MKTVYYVCKGAKLECSEGSAPSFLGVVRPNVSLCGQPMANVMDHKTGVNIMPAAFVVCKSKINPAVAASPAKQAPCTPAPTIFWTGGEMNVSVNGDPALLDTSECKCLLGGTIKITDPGQKIVSCGVPDSPKPATGAAIAAEPKKTNAEEPPKPVEPATPVAQAAPTEPDAKPATPVAVASDTKSVNQTEGQTEKKCASCGKEHIDLSAKVEWRTQFDGSANQNKACFDTCKKILRQVPELDESSGNRGLEYQVSKEKLNSSEKDKKDQKKYIEVNFEEAKEGVAYMDQQLEAGYPVIIGVDHTYGLGYNNDKSTDHFVLTVGRECDDKGTYYLFYEVGTKVKENGESKKNKLYLGEDFSLRGSTAYIKADTGKSPKYVVTQIRKNVLKNETGALP